VLEPVREVFMPGDRFAPKPLRHLVIISRVLIIITHQWVNLTIFLKSHHLEAVK
jgi:hypothetical protein